MKIAIAVFISAINDYKKTRNCNIILVETAAPQCFSTFDKNIVTDEPIYVSCIEKPAPQLSPMKDKPWAVEM